MSQSSKIVLKCMLMLVVLSVLASCDMALRKDTDAPLSSPVPSPIETVQVTIVPLPPPTEHIPSTSTPAPTQPTLTQTPLPPPPHPTSFPTATIPVATPSTVTATPYAGTPTLVAGATGGTLTQNIAWGVQTSNSVAIWSGIYEDAPTPHISGASAIAKWDTSLKLVDMKASPNRQFLAVLLADAKLTGEGEISGWLYVIDLSTNNVQSIPDDSHYKLYEYSIYQPPSRILGWLDDERLAVQQDIDAGVVVATRDGASYSKLSFPSQYSFAPASALSPDGTTLFSLITGQGSGYWLYSAEGASANAQQIAEQADSKVLYYPVWSPDGEYIAFMSPKAEASGLNDRYSAIWLLASSTFSQIQLSPDSVWDVDPTWSANGSKIAFLRADGAITDGNVWYNRPEMVESNIFVADTSDLLPEQLTSLSGAKNSSLARTSGGNLVLSSTVGSTSGTPSLVAALSSDGSIVILIAPAQGASLVHPALFQAVINGRN